MKYKVLSNEAKIELFKSSKFRNLTTSPEHIIRNMEQELSREREVTLESLTQYFNTLLGWAATYDLWLKESAKQRAEKRKDVVEGSPEPSPSLDKNEQALLNAVKRLGRDPKTRNEVIFLYREERGKLGLSTEFKTISGLSGQMARALKSLGAKGLINYADIKAHKDGATL